MVTVIFIATSRCPYAGWAGAVLIYEGLCRDAAKLQNVRLVVRMDSGQPRVCGNRPVQVFVPGAGIGPAYRDTEEGHGRLSDII